MNLSTGVQKMREGLFAYHMESEFVIKIFDLSINTKSLQLVLAIKL